MKIVIRKKGVQFPIKVYHDSRKVRFNRISKILFVTDSIQPFSDAAGQEKYTLTKPPRLAWFTCDDSDLEEILVEFEVE